MARPVMRVAKLWRYPVKSMAGESLADAVLRRGLAAAAPHLILGDVPGLAEREWERSRADTSRRAGCSIVPSMLRTSSFAEGIDTATEHVLAAKTGAERLAIAAAMYRSARRMLSHHLRCEHPDWSAEQVAAETARRLAHGAG